MVKPPNGTLPQRFNVKAFLADLAAEVQRRDWCARDGTPFQNGDETCIRCALPRDVQPSTTVAA